MDNMDGTICIDYRKWVIQFLFTSEFFLATYGDAIEEFLVILFKKRDLEAVRKILEMADNSSGVRENIISMIEKIAQKESATETPKIEKKLFLHQLITGKILTKRESISIAKIFPCRIILSGVLGLDGLSENEEVEMRQLNKSFENKVG